MIRQILNNNQLTGLGPSPIKDGSTDGTSTFEMGRRMFSTMLIQTPLQKNGKKWLGGANRDASQIAINRRTIEIGKGSLNMPTSTDTNPTLSFTNNKDTNMIYRHLQKTRSGGAVVPPKCRV
jgi:hypothetical protein